VTPGPGAGPAVIEAFLTDTWTSSLVRGPRAVVVIALGAAAGVAVGWTGWAAGVVVIAGGAVALAVATAIADRPRRRAQDGYARYVSLRQARWVRDTGGAAPLGGRGEAEVWLGAHQPGSVPQVYRTLAAGLAGNEHVWARELEAMPSTTPEDLAWRAYAEASHELDATGAADTTRLTAAAEALPDGPDRAWHRDWLVLADAVRAHAEGRPGWLDGLAGLASDAPAPAAATPAAPDPAGPAPTPRRRRLRLALGRWVAVIAFLLTALPLAVTAAGIPGIVDRVPAEYARTSFFTRGEVADPDMDAVARVTPALARAVARASTVDAVTEGPDPFNASIDAGLPTLIWRVGDIDLAPPPDAAGRHVWSVEVLLGVADPARGTLIVTYGNEGGPAGLYALDADLVARLRAAVLRAP
jgi:hypothetical protein